MRADASAPAAPSRGDVEIVTPLGSGGMATVYLGRMHRQAGFVRPVAVKVLHPQHADDLELVQLFLQEARLVSRVRHPNVVAPLDLSVTPGEVRMVMEYVHGVTLAELVRGVRQAGTVVPPAIISAIVTGVLEGLHAAHELRGEDGVPLQPVHRDVSPQNVMLGVHGEVKVLDFGVAKVVGLAPSTRSGRLKGKLAYMAPEQLQGRRLDRRADLYAVGVMTWELLTLRRLCDGDSEAHVVTQVLSAEPAALSAVAPGVPGELDALVLRALAKDPGARFADARLMAAALEQIVPPASPRALGAWVSAHAGEVLARRDSLLQALERGDRAVSADGGPELATSATRPTRIERPASAPAATTSRVGAVASRWRRVAVAAGAVASAALAVVLLWTRPNEAPAPVPAVSHVPAPAPPSARPSPAPTGVPPAPAPTTPAPASVPPPREPTAETARPDAPATARKSPRKPVPRRPAARPRSTQEGAPDCSEPYVWKDGIKYPRSECF